MTAYTVTTAKHATLTAGLVDSVTFNGYLAKVAVLNRGATELYFTLDGSTPTTGGDNTYVVLAGGTTRATPPGSSPVLKLISTAAVAYSVVAE